MCLRSVYQEILRVFGPQQRDRRGPNQSHNYSDHEASCHSKGNKELSGKSFLHIEVHPRLGINHFSLCQVSQEGTKLRVGKGTADSLWKATVDYDKPPSSASPNSQKTTVTLPGLKPICHRCFDRPRRWRQY